MSYQEQYQTKINTFNNVLAQYFVVRGYSNAQIVEIARALWSCEPIIPYIQPTEIEIVDRALQVVALTNNDTGAMMTAATIAAAFSIFDDTIRFIKDNTFPTLNWSDLTTTPVLPWKEQVADLTADILCHARILLGNYARSELPSLWSYAGLLEDIPSARCIDLDVIVALWRDLDLPLPMEDGIINDLILQLHHVIAHVYTQGLTEENRHVTLAIFQTVRDTIKNIPIGPIVKPKLLVKDLHKEGIRILLVYPTLGKSYAAVNAAHPFMDLDKSYLHYGIKVDQYLSVIQRALERSPEITVLASLDVELVQALIRQKIPFAIYRPDPGEASKDCIIGRMKDRQTPHEYIELVMQGWQAFADEMSLLERTHRLPVQLVSAGQYLSDFIGQ